MSATLPQTQPASDIHSFIRAMPKAELHIHLEGAIQPETLLALAHKHGRIDLLPGDTVEALRDLFVFRDFPHFLQVFITIAHLLLDAEDFATIVYACGADMAAQNIRYREITFTPYTHGHLLSKQVPIEVMFEGLSEGRARALRDFGVEMRWVFDVGRNVSFHSGTYDPMPAEITLDYALRGRDQGVIGFGLGGFEEGAPPEPFAHAFEKAKAAGLLSVPHAGETQGAPSVWGAINELQADRIGHGVRAIEDVDLLKRLRDEQIPLEINPTSNICLHVYRSLAAHPFPHLDAMGLFLTVNSDDPPLFNTSLVQEYALLANEFGYDRANLARIARNAFLASGAPSPLKSALLNEFDEWAAQSVR